MAEKLPGRPDLAEMLIPDFAVGCRRITPGGGFLEARESSLDVQLLKAETQKLKYPIQ